MAIKGDQASIMRRKTFILQDQKTKNRMKSYKIGFALPFMQGDDWHSSMFVSQFFPA